MSEVKQNKKERAAILSSISSFALTLGKFIIGAMTGSLGILSEAIHSLIDFVATLVTYFAVKISGKPADEDHHYGHDKVESLAALVETGLLFATSAWIIYEAIKRLFFQGEAEVSVTWYALLIIFISIVIDFTRSRNLMKVAKETGSQALEADALHFSSDMWSSFAVLIGLGFTYMGFKIADPLSAIIVSIIILKAGFDLLNRSLSVLTDKAPAGVSDNISSIIDNIKEVEEVNDLNVRSLDGTKIFTDVSILLQKDMTLAEASKIKNKVIEEIKKVYVDSYVVVHIDAKG